MGLTMVQFLLRRVLGLTPGLSGPGGGSTGKV
jgi:hypothetical protein